MVILVFKLLQKRVETCILKTRFTQNCQKIKYQMKKDIFIKLFCSWRYTIGKKYIGIGRIQKKSSGISESSENADTYPLTLTDFLALCLVTSCFAMFLSFKPFSAKIQRSNYFSLKSMLKLARWNSSILKDVIEERLVAPKFQGFSLKSHIFLPWLYMRRRRCHLKKYISCISFVSANRLFRYSEI